MSTISINVPGSLAETFRNANESTREKAEQFISAWLKTFLYNKPDDEELLRIMQMASVIAHKNGLTQDKLNELLQDE